LHRHQKRKGTETVYVSHLLGVASLVLEYGGDEKQAIAALLHDAMEDQGATFAAIEQLFGTDVARIVAACTDGVPDAAGIKPEWRPRKEAYIAHLAKVESDVLLVSVADKLYNARAILADYREMKEELWPRFSAGRETLWYYRALADKFAELVPAKGNLRRLVNELEFTVSLLENEAGKA
jgi:(p)ppGpp synthase/HD superfamily hydrolase